MKKILLFFLFLNNVAFAQNPIPELGKAFDDTTIPRIDISVAVNDLTAILDPNNAYSNTEYMADFVFDNGQAKDTILNVGFRLRGNTSRTAEKKSFKVSFNTFESGRKFDGLEKMNLNGEHNDPSIIRSKLCWDLLRKMEIPAPRANHVDLYINGNYYGLYMNVEHIDEEFADLRFGNGDGNLYKCTYPVDFTYLGNNPNLYKFSNNVRAYELKTNTDLDDYSDLANFIDILNNEPLATLPCELEAIFNVDSYLKAMAVDVITGNWDGPIWNKNNCYIYKNTATNRFEYIPFDLDNTFGINYFAGLNWATRNIYQWSRDNEPRPIYERILAVQEYEDRFSYYVNDLLQNHWDTTTFFPIIDQIKAKITASAISDTYRTLDYGFTIQDFHDSYVQSVGFSTPQGLKEYIVIRRQTAMSQLVLNDIKPVLSDLNALVDIPSQKINLTVKVMDNQSNLTVKVFYNQNGSPFSSAELFDDGNHGDEQANDGIFGGAITLNIGSGMVDYYVNAVDNQNNSSRFPRCEERSIRFNPSLPKLVINELMASNEMTFLDEADEFDDWIEIYNADNQPIFLGDKYLSDNSSNPAKWQFPAITLKADEYLLIWADEDGGQGELHANFKLQKSGETLGIYSNENDGYAPIDVINYPSQTTDISYGRLPNGVGAFQVLPFVSPNRNNEDSIFIPVKLPVERVLVYPNPFSESVTLSHFYENVSLKIYNSIGQEVFSDDDISRNYVWYGVNKNGASLSNGVYIMVIFSYENEKWKAVKSCRVVINN